ncbi:MAG: tetratricopeptide repeat protein, partial [Planctomycetes bacterium]|nr:tetratricopeptide repeat protein [Planctomycetota bacterium]
MAIRQQQVVFVFAALVVGWGAYSSLGSGSSRRASGGSGSAPEFVDHPAPDVDLVRSASRDSNALLREFFTEPSDTRPLPLLDFEVPPLAPLPGLRPAPAAGPKPSLFAQYLRTTRQPETVGGLFDDLGSDEGANLDEVIDSAEGVDWNLLTPEEKAERLESYRRQYDWILTNQLHYGRILNRNRFELRMPITEPILFLELDPETGQERFPGMAPVAYETEKHSIESFGLADTPLNRLELERVEFPAELTRGQYGTVMSFADRAYLAREAGPRALEIAEEFYRKAATLTSEAAPRLGLARCFEAGFRFEQAFAEYNALLRGGFEDNPVVLARLGVLESRFRLFDLAEEHLQQASRFGRAEWEVQLALGNFKLRRHMPGEALEALQRAARNEPQAAEHQRVRAWIRSLLGD